MCSSSTPCWSATEGIQRRSHFELWKLGVTMENFKAFMLRSGRAAAQVAVEPLDRIFRVDIGPEPTQKDDVAE